MKNLIKASAAVITAALFGACNTAQPTPPCAVGHGGFGAAYTYVSGDNDVNSPCFRTGDIIGVQKYRQTTGASQIYLKPESIALYDYGLLGFETTALASGPLTSEFPDDDGFCTVTSMEPATGILNSAALTATAADDEELTFAFSNVEFYVRGSVAGTQFNADLTISGDTCSTTYRVNAMYPVIFCNAHDEDGVYLATGDDAACTQTDHVWSGYPANPAFTSRCVQYGNPEEDPEAYDYGILGDPPDQPYVPWFVCAPAGEAPSLLEGRD